MESADFEVKRIKKQKKGEIVNDAILRLIVNGTLKPGDKLPPEGVLVERFGVSRVTIRESLKRLSFMGVITIRQGDGTYISKVTPANYLKPLFPLIAFERNNISEMYEARMYIEGGASEMAALNRTDEDIELLTGNLNSMKAAIEIDDKTEYSAHDKQFHHNICLASKNRILLTTHSMLWDIILGCIGRINTTMSIIENSMKYHEMILDAIINNRAETANILMKEHLFVSKSILLEQLDNNEEYAND